jgi:hypothetical protein
MPGPVVNWFALQDFAGIRTHAIGGLMDGPEENTRDRPLLAQTGY